MMLQLAFHGFMNRFQYGNKRFPGFFSLHSFAFMKEGKDAERKGCAYMGTYFKWTM